MNTEKVLKRAVDWMGKPEEIYIGNIKIGDRDEEIKILSYESNKSIRSVSIGASRIPVYGSDHLFVGKKGVRYEFIIHHTGNFEATVLSLESLRMLAGYSFYAERFISIGDMIPMGENFRLFDDGEMQYMLLIEPFFDDENTFTPNPHGQSSDGNYLIQFLWAIPIYQSEAAFIKSHGFEVFVETYVSSTDEVANWKRRPWV